MPRISHPKYLECYSTLLLSTLKNKVPPPLPLTKWSVFRVALLYIYGLLWSLSTCSTKQYPLEVFNFAITLAAKSRLSQKQPVSTLVRTI